MPKKQIQIKKLIPKDNRLLVISSTEEMFNVFAKDLIDKLSEGMLINATFEVKEVGDKIFNNILNFEVVSEKDQTKI